MLDDDLFILPIPLIFWSFFICYRYDIKKIFSNCTSSDFFEVKRTEVLANYFDFPIEAAKIINTFCGPFGTLEQALSPTYICQNFGQKYIHPYQPIIYSFQFTSKKVLTTYFDCRKSNEHKFTIISSHEIKVDFDHFFLIFKFSEFYNSLTRHYYLTNFPQISIEQQDLILSKENLQAIKTRYKWRMRVMSYPELF